jgi:hypothetical protein
MCRLQFSSDAGLQHHHQQAQPSEPYADADDCVAALLALAAHNDGEFDLPEEPLPSSLKEVSTACSAGGRTPRPARGLQRAYWALVGRGSTAGAPWENLLLCVLVGLVRRTAKEEAVLLSGRRALAGMHSFHYSR